MSEEFKNEFDENKETETDNVNTQEETETVFEDNASKPEETTNESAVTQEPGNAPTPENPIYARAYQPHEQRESTKEEWYQEAQQEQKQHLNQLFILHIFEILICRQQHRKHLCAVHRCNRQYIVHRQRNIIICQIMKQCADIIPLAPECAISQKEHQTQNEIDYGRQNHNQKRISFSVFII